MIDKGLIRNRLLARISRDPISKCWIYLGFWTDEGEARMRVGGKVYSIRRVSAWLFKGVDLWEDVYVYRICQSPACCNPRHISVAANFQEALADLRERGVYTHPGRKILMPMTRRCIRARLESGESAVAIANQNNLNPVTVRRCGLSKS